MTSSFPPAAPEDDAALRLSELRPELRRYCRALTGSDWDADDVAQDAILKVMERCRERPDVKPTKSYVFRAARNAWIDRCRVMSRRSAIPLEALAAEPAAGDAPDAFITQELLERLMHRLTPKPFVILLLCDVFGWTARETGARMDMAEAAVQVTLSRVRRRLRALASRGGAEDADDAARRNRAGGAADAPARLLEAVTDAFRRHDPHRIYDAYLRLYESGSRMADVRVREGRLFFTIRDPDGNAIRVECE